MLLDKINVAKLFCKKSPSLSLCKEGDLPHLNFSNLKGTYSRLGSMFVSKNYFIFYRILTESHPKMYEWFWKVLNNKQSSNHS